MRITVLAGGVGAARFLDGLVQVVDPTAVTVVANVGDDLDLLGLRITPDIDTILYTLGGVVHPEQGWGRAGETTHALDVVRELGGDAWFLLGDRDIGMHLVRSERLRGGARLSEVTAELACSFGLTLTLLPASDDPLTTMVETPHGEIDFQTYFVRNRHEDEVLAVRYAGADEAAPAPGVLEAIADAELLLIAPSNPYLSIGPILALPGVREACRSRSGPAAAISPIVGGRAIKGPADRLLRRFAGEASPVAIARVYEDFLTHLLLDDEDAGDLARVEALGVRAGATDTIMRDRAARARIAAAALELAAG